MDYAVREYNPCGVGWEEGDPTETWMQNARPEDASAILATPVNEVDEGVGLPIPDESRSPWFWMRFPNGDLLLGCWPQGDAYFIGEANREV